MKPLPKIVQWQFQKALSVSVLPHPDADQLTAFMERSLSRSERTAVLEHLSQCSECRQVAAFADVLTLPALKLRGARRGARLWRPIFAWGGLAACVLVVALLFVGRGNQRTELVEVTREQPLQDSSGSGSPTGTHTKAVDAMKEAGGSAGRNAADLNGATSNRVSSNGPSSKETANVLRSPDAASGMARDLPQGIQNVAAAKAGKDQSSTPATSSPMADAISARQTVATPSANAANNSAIDMRASFAPSVPNTTVPTSNIDDRYPRWTLNSDGTLLRSLDTGASWQKISIPGNAALLHSIATAGAEVWVGGASGALYHSADEGGHWMQVNPAVGGKLLADDVISIEFATAQRGKFVTSKQEVWTTADGGQSWSKK